MLAARVARRCGRAGMNEMSLSQVQQMAATFFHAEERRAWVRTSTHTVVYDRDPDYPRFAKDPGGTVKRMVRIWLAEPRDNQPARGEAGQSFLRAYLGTVMFCFGGPSFRELCRLFHLTSRAAKAAGQSAKSLRRDLAALLRTYIREEYRPSNLAPRS